MQISDREETRAKQGVKASLRVSKQREDLLNFSSIFLTFLLHYKNRVHFH